ncbi:hypothetical protein [Anabaena lutea]|uniref:hypothetical protein n=1 Tax=Anabaena lutea TaxID=212350 RepID=UPI001689D3A7|nr:hypothetical protein [Anabaena lutea]
MGRWGDGETRGQTRGKLRITCSLHPAPCTLHPAPCPLQESLFIPYGLQQTINTSIYGNLGKNLDSLYRSNQKYS